MYMCVTKYQIFKDTERLSVDVHLVLTFKCVFSLGFMYILCTSKKYVHI